MDDEAPPRHATALRALARGLVVASAMAALSLAAWLMNASPLPLLLAIAAGAGATTAVVDALERHLVSRGHGLLVVAFATAMAAGGLLTLVVAQAHLAAGWWSSTPDAAITAALQREPLVLVVAVSAGLGAALAMGLAVLMPELPYDARFTSHEGSVAGGVMVLAVGFLVSGVLGARAVALPIQAAGLALALTEACGPLSRVLIERALGPESRERGPPLAAR